MPRVFHKGFTSELIVSWIVVQTIFTVSVTSQGSLSWFSSIPSWLQSAFTFRGYNVPSIQICCKFSDFPKFCQMFHHSFHLSNVVKSPGGHRVGSISVVGALRLTWTLLLGRQRQGAFSHRRVEDVVLRWCLVFPREFTPWKSMLCRVKVEKDWQICRCFYTEMLKTIRWNVKLSDLWLFPIFLKPV